MSDDFEQRDLRLAKRARMLDEGAQTYFTPTVSLTPLSEIHDNYMNLNVGAETSDMVNIMGRVMHIRRAGGKLCFVVLQQGDGSRLQVIIAANEVEVEGVKRFKADVDLGDFLFVYGNVCSSLTGELSVRAHAFEVATKSVRPLPTLHDEMSEENRVRQRYLDLIVNQSARDMVELRSKTVRGIRRHLEDLDYLEVETPMLQTVHGGANARPFTTHSNALDTDLFLRIAPELFLKRCVIGGMERVFEINRNFRNEGMDSTHSPEFSTLEFYQVGANYQDMADLVEQMVCSVARSVTGNTVIEINGETVNLSEEWQWVSMYESLSAVTGIEVTPETERSRLLSLMHETAFNTCLAEQDGKRDDAWISRVAERIESKMKFISDNYSHGKLVEELWEEYVLPTLGNGPVFVYDFPVDTSPLVAPHPTHPGIVQKWDLYLGGMELGTGYSELTDPVIQRQRFEEQVAQRDSDDEAMAMDEDFLVAMEYGMPPTGGVGIGIDRLLMAFSGKGIRETILFPLVRKI